MTHIAVVGVFAWGWSRTQTEFTELSRMRVPVCSLTLSTICWMLL